MLLLISHSLQPARHIFLLYSPGYMIFLAAPMIQTTVFYTLNANVRLQVQLTMEHVGHMPAYGADQWTPWRYSC